MTTATNSYYLDEPGTGRLEVFPIAADEAVLLPFITHIFSKYWDRVLFGTAVQGGIFEVRAPNAPTDIGMLDGYLTVDFGSWHFHLCIGEHKGTKRNPCPPELAAHRKTSRAELYRRLNDEGIPTGWAFRMFNGKDEQQMTVFLPNPFLSVEQKLLKEPDFSQLQCWDELREQFLQLPADELDRQGKGFRHG